MPTSLAWVAIALPFDGNVTMPTSTIMTKAKTPNNTPPILHVNEDVSLEEQNAQRAHELWQHRNGEHGHDLIDWLQAEREINEWHQNRIRKETPNNPGLLTSH
jgi:hypothetical protein